MLKNKNIILGVTGSIAAYKVAILIRLLVKEGANVKVVMTPLAKEFISPLTMATLAKNPVLVDFYNPENGDWNSHVSLGLWADAYLVAPATANTIAKMANGIVDNLLLTTYLSAKCPVFIAPAMDLDMYKHRATQKNILTLKSFGNIFIEPEEGELASGLTGKGRLAEPEFITEEIKKFFSKKKSFINKKILITAGPTYEKIDSVRFIGNYSSGKMGFEIAKECAERGAEVVVIAGPTNSETEQKNIEIIRVETAKEMYEKCLKYFVYSDITILTAAVADFTIENPAKTKIKREKEKILLELVPTTDIAVTLGKHKTNKQILVGFALENSDELKNAIEKLKRKNFDFIVLNSLNDKGAGFGFDTNKISIIDKNENIKNFELKPKSEVAKDIINYLENIIIHSKQ